MLRYTFDTPQDDLRREFFSYDRPDVLAALKRNQPGFRRHFL